MALDGTEFQGWILRNHSAVTIYLGDSNVTVAAGFPVDAGVTFSPSEIAHGQLSDKVVSLRLFAVAGSTANDVRVLVPGRS